MVWEAPQPTTCTFMHCIISTLNNTIIRKQLLDRESTQEQILFETSQIIHCRINGCKSYMTLYCLLGRRRRKRTDLLPYMKIIILIDLFYSPEASYF